MHNWNGLAALGACALMCSIGCGDGRQSVGDRAFEEESAQNLYGYCSGHWLNLSDNVLNCGACGRACAAGQVCASGHCVNNPCAAGQTWCSGYGCIDTNTNWDNCGACGHACQVDETCFGGVCKADCDWNLTTCSDGSCADLKNDKSNCGACFHVCPAGQDCKEGACVTSTCPAGQTWCTGYGCTNTATSWDNCGACGHHCQVDETCFGGVCKPDCDWSLTTCPDGSCADTDNDPANCGACGHACAAGQTCKWGECYGPITTCPAGKTWCHGYGCVDTATNWDNCGACGHACQVDETCFGGVCKPDCDWDLTTCSDGSCADTANDPQNCGACGHQCAAGQTCVSGVCQGPACPAGQHLCGADCKSNNSVNSCGTSCTPCPVPANGVATCDGTACGFTCNAGYVKWGDACVQAKRVFATSTFYNADLGGLAGADAKCQARADAAGLSGTYKAWLSSQTVSARNRLTHFAGPYVLVSGAIVADNWAALVNGGVEHKINRTEMNTVPPTGPDCANTVGSVVFTNTNGSGAAIGVGQIVNGVPYTACSNWTSTSSMTAPILGDTGATYSSTGRALWTNSCIGRCNMQALLYCFEQ